MSRQQRRAPKSPDTKIWHPRNLGASAEGPFEGWAQSVVSSGPNVRRSKMFQFPLLLAKDHNSTGFKEIENKSENSVHSEDPCNQGYIQKRVHIHCLSR